MPVVKNPFLSTDARGSLFGLTASMSRGGNTIKKKANPSHKLEPYLNRVRAILGYLSRQWGLLTAGERASWGAWAVDHPGTDKFGDPFIMSGFNAFIMLNHHAVRFGTGADMNRLPPEVAPVSAIDVLTAAAGALLEGDVDLSWTELGAGIAADFWEIQIAGPFQSPGRVSVSSRFHFVASVAGNVLLETIADLDVGMYYWFRVRYVAADGQKTAWGQAQATPKVGV